MTRLPPLLLAVTLLFILSLSVQAQTRVEAGVAAGMQSHEGAADDPRVLTGVEVLALRQRLGAHVAVEYADLAFGGALYTTHANVAWRWAFSPAVSLMIGAGPTFLSSEYGNETTLNGEAELSRRFGSINWFVRVRHFDYSLYGFRDFVSPGGPAFYAGARYAFRQR